MREYWTSTVFRTHGALYAGILEGAKPGGKIEAQHIRRILSRSGVPARGRVLDIACGIGRHIVPLAVSGYRAVGCDFSPLYLQRARKYAEESGLGRDRIHFYRSDYRRIDRTLHLAREPPFDAAMSIFTSMGHYGEEGDLTTLTAVRRVVRPGGVFVMEMSNRDWIMRNFRATGVMGSGGDLEIHEVRRFDLERSVSEADWTYYRGSGRRRRKLLEVEVSVRLYSLHELKSLFERAGWEYVRSYGGLANPGPANLDSNRMVVVARRPSR